jgi:hypothetical protein
MQSFRTLRVWEKSVVVQFARSLTTKATKVHEGNIEPKAFVILRALGGSGFRRLHRETAPLPKNRIA